MEAKIVVVTWIDASHQHGPLDADEFTPTVTQVEAGWLAAEDEDNISVALDYSQCDGSWRHVTHIPKKYVKEIRHTTVGKMKRRRK